MGKEGIGGFLNRELLYLCEGDSRGRQLPKQLAEHRQSPQESVSPQANVFIIIFNSTHIDRLMHPRYDIESAHGKAD